VSKHGPFSNIDIRILQTRVKEFQILKFGNLNINRPLEQAVGSVVKDCTDILFKVDKTETNICKLIDGMLKLTGLVKDLSHQLTSKSFEVEQVKDEIVFTAENCIKKIEGAELESVLIEILHKYELLDNMS
jgi:hypothetical protein